MEIEQRGAGQPVMEAEVLRQIADASASLGVASGFAEDARPAAGRSDQAQQDLDGRSLAGSVRAEKTKDFTRLDGQVQPVKSNLAAIFLAETDRFKCWTR